MPAAVRQGTRLSSPDIVARLRERRVIALLAQAPGGVVDDWAAFAKAADCGIPEVRAEAERVKGQPQLWDDLIIDGLSTGCASIPFEASVIVERLRELRMRDPRQEAWTAEDDVALLSLVQANGRMWTSTGSLLRRSPIGCWERHGQLTYG
jgi:hypothetical protein